jgi:carbon monoxide dehydrogenase subunit G
MQLDSAFDVTAPIDQVWATLMDFERVAGCLPGAQVLNTLSEDAYQVGMKIKLGPVTMTYKGQLEVVERKPELHKATLRGKAKEARGQGTAEATAYLALTEDGPVTHGTVSADVSLSGRAAAMGQIVINSVTEQMMAQFATNLQALLSAPEAPAAPATPAAAASQAAASPEAAAETPTTETTDPAPKKANATPRKRTAAKAAVAADGSLTAVSAAVPANGAGDAALLRGTPAPSAPVAAPVSTPAPVSDLGGAHRAPAAVAPDNSLDALALARGIAEAQLREPKKALAFVAFVAFLAYLLGRRSARRS